MAVYRKFLVRIRCVKVVLAIIGNCYTGWEATSVSEGCCFATLLLVAIVKFCLLGFEKQIVVIVRHVCVKRWQLWMALLLYHYTVGSTLVRQINY